MKFFATALLLAGSACALNPPTPDRSVQCLTCQKLVDHVDEKWSNSTTVADVLTNLKSTCEAKAGDHVEGCDKIAEALVQIPPAIFSGLDDIEWPHDTGICAALNQCQMECCNKNDPPEQVHLSLPKGGHDSYDVMGVSWVSLNQAGSVVQWGLSSSDLSNEFTGYIAEYQGYTAGWVGQVHRATMSGLQPATTYFYRVGDGASKWSQVFSFKTYDPSKAARFLIIGDMDFGVASDNTVAHMISLVENGEVDVVVHTGDISYADGYEKHWDDFMNKIEPIAARVPYMVAPGNHEFMWAFAAYKTRFFMPSIMDQPEGKQQYGSGDNMYFSWNYGQAHWVTCNSETIIDTGKFSDDMVAFAQADLASVDRKVTPWVVANFHRPMYCVGDSECDVGASFAQRLKHALEKTFYDEGVNLVINGHIHAYQRSYPVYREAVRAQEYWNSRAPVHIVQGASGNREGQKGTINTDKPWSAFHLEGKESVGYGILTVAQHTMNWQYFSSSTGEILDEMVMKRT